MQLREGWAKINEEADIQKDRRRKEYSEKHDVPISIPVSLPSVPMRRDAGTSRMGVSSAGRRRTVSVTSG